MPVLTNRTQACKMFELVPLFLQLLFLNSDESKLPRVTDIIIIIIIVVVMCHCHRDFRVVAFLRILAALTRLDDHVGKLFDLGCVANIVEDGQWLQILGHAARGSRSFRIYGIVQTEDLGMLSV